MKDRLFDDATPMQIDPIVSLFRFSVFRYEYPVDPLARGQRSGGLRRILASGMFAPHYRANRSHRLPQCPAFPAQSHALYVAIASPLIRAGGGSALSPSVTTAQLRASNCTSSTTAEDKSLYWAPTL